MEPKPGIPPTRAYLGGLVSPLEKQPATAIIRAAHQDTKPGNWLAERTDGPTVELAYTVGEAPVKPVTCSAFSLTR